MADHIAHWGATANTTVAQRLANIHAVRQSLLEPEASTEPPPGWTWPVCDDCLNIGHDAGVNGCVEQARFMEQIGAELPRPPLRDGPGPRGTGPGISAPAAAR